jgi:nucleoside-diphosphate-sugar epimerase
MNAAWQEAMNVFLTGASGVIGRRAIPLLLRQGHSVTAVVHTAEKRKAVEGLGAKANDVSLFDAPGLRRALEGYDVVVNLATHMPASITRTLLPGAWTENDRIRREGSRNLVDAAISAGVQCFVQESFAPVYPDRGSAWIDESVPLEPVAYNRTVVDAERSAEHFNGGSRRGIVLRFAAFYGPDSRMHADVMRLVRRGFAPMPGPAGAFISSVSHDDAASAVVAALELPAGVYNVSDDEPVTHREYFDALAAALGIRAPKLPPVWATFLFGSIGKLASRSLRISNRRLRETATWAPRYPSVREGWRDAATPSASEITVDSRAT